MSVTGRLTLLVKVSRIAGWCFGPILYTIGVIHSRALPKTIPALLRYGTQVASLSFPLCIVVFGVNDVYDYESDMRNPRKNAQSLEGGVLEPAHHAFVLHSARLASLFILLSSLSPFISLPLGIPTIRGLQGPLLTLVLLFLSWQYSAPPLRLKERPILDSLSNGAIVWLSWAIGYVAGGLPLLGPGAAESTHKGWVLALCTTGVHALGAAADLDADVAAGQRTIAVVLGKRLTAIFCGLCYYLASTTVETNSFVGVYTYVGLAISLVPTISPALSHFSFKALVFASVIGASGWIGERAFSILKGSKSS